MPFLCFGSSKNSTSDQPKTTTSSSKRMSVLGLQQNAESPFPKDPKVAAWKKDSDLQSSPSSTAATATNVEEPKQAAHQKDPRIEKLFNEIEPIRKKLVDHPVYAMVNTVDKLCLFMQSHIYAVWDFMSLLKHLQQELTCIDLPWVPVGDPRTRYLINEIVCDEESDVSEEGVRMSHFELYLLGMKGAGAATNQIELFIQTMIKARAHAKTTGITAGSSEIVSQSLASVNAPKHVQEFVRSTFDVINAGKLHVAAAVFTFGREDLIPHMFISFVRDLHQENPEKFQIFKYYLERHIEVDGDHHSILAHEMTALLCGDDEQKWAEATEAVKYTLQARVDLWDGIQREYESQQ